LTHRTVYSRTQKINTVANLLEIIDIKFLQNMQDFFANTMNVSLQTFDASGPLTNPSNFTDICGTYTQNSKEGLRRCNACLDKWIKEVEKKDKPIIFKCHLGLENFGIPIMIQGKCIATILGGKVLTSPPDEKHFRKLARELSLNEDEYVAAAKKIRITPPEKTKATADALCIVTNAMVAISHANFQLSKLGMEYKLPRNIAVEEWLFLNSENTKKCLTARELDVLKLLVLGKTNLEIAGELYISVHTAKSHVSSIMEKLLVDDRVQVAVKAIREGLV
jgi:ligand-binding sensor protein/DNA-binding CsgD family transcriptional regulator